jgi:hypothetical protein
VLQNGLLVRPAGGHAIRDLWRQDNRQTSVEAGQPSSSEKGIQLASRLKRVKIVIATHMGRPDENLWYGPAAVCALHHLCAAFGLRVQADFGKADAFGGQQTFGRVTEPTSVGGVQFDSLHGVFPKYWFEPYLGVFDHPC